MCSSDLQWRKVHLGIDAETLDIRAIEVTTNSIGDAPTLPDLLAQIGQDEARRRYPLGMFDEAVEGLPGRHQTGDFTGMHIGDSAGQSTVQDLAP